MDINIIAADYHDSTQAQDIVYLLNSYAQDVMGGSAPLSTYCQENLITNMIESSLTFSVLCYVNGQPAGLVNCVKGFSTFYAKPLVNIHDVFVATPFRGLQLSQKMLLKVEEMAKAEGSCKLTLEVLTGNNIAKSAYAKAGFSAYELEPAVGSAVFWQKKLN